MKKKIPSFKSDTEAETFVAEADLTEFDLSGAKPMRFEFAQKTERVNMRVPASLLEAVKAAAARKKMPYQRFIRQVLEDAVAKQSRRSS